MNKINRFYHYTGSGKIFYTIIGEPSPEKICTIIFLPLFEERMWSQRIVFNFALELAEKNGVAVIYDYTGYGESDGDTEDFSFSQCQHDLNSLLATIKETFHLTKFTFLGVRTGCSIIVDYFNQIKTHDTAIVLWAPVLDIEKFVFKELRSTISTQSYVLKKIIAKREVILEELKKHGKCEKKGYLLNHIDGYRIGKTFQDEFSSFDGQSMLKELECPKLYIDVIPIKKLKMQDSIKEKMLAELSDVKNLNYKIIAANEFWINSRDYTQKSIDVYHATLQWYEKQIN